MPQSVENAARAARRGFTLIEMLVVAGLVVILMGFAAAGVRGLQVSTRRAKCASNLRQMITAALAYADDHKGEFPWAARRVDGYESYCWDFIVPAGAAPQPGAMWNGYGINSVLQCPAYLGGAANWQNDPYTGYNYNSSFVGKAEGDAAMRNAPVRLAQIKDPARTAVFGDGHWSGGANKFMRSPKADLASDYSGKGIREGGTQGFRHGGKTNVAFADGHVEALSQSYTQAGKKGFVSSDGAGVKCGFISADNSLYDLQ